MKLKVLICLLLGGVTLALYWPARHFGIVYFDDPLFVTENMEIANGLTWHSLWWAMSGVLVANWHPVTSLSFVIGHQLWGTNPGAEHLVNAAVHAANAALLFLVLARMTRRVWPGAVAAAVFAWHPLRVESVAWISERKDVLCVFFFLLALWCYSRFAEAAKTPCFTKKLFYSLTLLCFVLGFMSKAMIVTLPFVLLLLDDWPLQRFTIYDLRFTIAPLLREKIPLFVLAAFFSWLTFWIQKTHAAVVGMNQLGLAGRAGNAAAGYVQYLGSFFRPLNLASIYPLPPSRDAVETALAALLLAAISALCICQLRRRPYLAAGWFWYLGTSVPIIGLVQVGGEAMADRYTYIPLIGPAVSLAWLGAEMFESRKWVSIGTATALCVACLALTSRQLQFWRDTETLAEHNVAVTPDNFLSHFIWAMALEHDGRFSRAMIQYRVSAAIEPFEYRAHYGLAQLLKRQGHLEAAAAEYDIVTRLGSNPDVHIAHLNEADALSQLGRAGEAAYHLDEALRVEPDSVVAMNNLAWLLATSTNAAVRDGPRAVQLADRACEITGGKQTICIGTLAAAYAEAGRFDDAIITAQKACDSARQLGETNLLQKNLQLIELYRSHKPFRE